MSDQIKENCIKLVGLIDKLDSYQNNLSESSGNVQAPTKYGLGGFSAAIGAIGSIAKIRGDFCAHWNEGDNTVIIEKKNNTNYLITLNPGKTLFKVDKYSLDFKETVIDILKTGAWIERFEKYVENQTKAFDLFIETKKRMEHDSKFGEVDF